MSGVQNQLPQGDSEAKIVEFEKICVANNEKITVLQNELQRKDHELAEYKQRVADMQEEVSLAQKIRAQRAKETEEVDLLKIQSEETLTKAKGIIFERTKVIKNQELQIDALNQQISSLKDVVSITKDLLEIRNLEIKQLETKTKCLEGKINAEKERHDLMHKKLEAMIRHNGELKREYETQLCLFQALRGRYNERELAKDVVDDLRNEVQEERNQIVNGAEAPEVEAPPEAGANPPVEGNNSENKAETPNQENGTQ